jgi:acetyltransferase
MPQAEASKARSTIDAWARLAAAAREGRSYLSEADAKQVVSAFGISVPTSVVVMTPQDAADALAVVTPPVVIKVLSADILHKTEVKGVVFPVHTAEEAIAACRRIEATTKVLRPAAQIDGFLVEAYLPAGIEWLLSGRVDARFGPLVAFGLGGTYTDFLRRISFRLAPLTDGDIDALLDETHSMMVLSGFRGAPPMNVTSLRRTIWQLSEFITSDLVKQYVTEIEINPLGVTESGIVALDALVGLRGTTQ